MFNRARLKLTGWYLLVMMVVSVAFSAVIYRVLSNEAARFARTQRLRIERQFGVLVPAAMEVELINDLEERIRIKLTLVNLAIGAGAGMLGFVVAGKTLTPIKEMVEEQNRFVSDASHELRTPLAALKSTMEVWLRGKRQTLVEARELMEGSIEEVNRLQKLADALLQLARSQQPNHKTTPAAVGLSEVVGEAVKKVRPGAQKKGVTIKIAETDARVMGNLGQLTDLVVILLDNAVKYSPEGGEVQVGVKRTKRGAALTVADRGMGIEVKDVPHIFDRFYRADAARSQDSGGGYGLGLAIAKKIAEEHEGTIQVKSQPGKGSTFTVTFPVRVSV